MSDTTIMGCKIILQENASISEVEELIHSIDCEWDTRDGDARLIDSMIKRLRSLIVIEESELEHLPFPTKPHKETRAYLNTRAFFIRMRKEASERSID